jgi:hypothetical protein
VDSQHDILGGGHLVAAQGAEVGGDLAIFEFLRISLLAIFRVCLDFGFRGKNELFFDEVALKNGRIVGLRNYFLKQKSSEKSCFSPEAKVQTYS